MSGSHGIGEVRAFETNHRDRPLTKRKAIPWGAAGMVALLVVIESFIVRHWIEFTDPVSLSWRFSAQVAEMTGPECDVLCLGDSLVKHGLIPSVIEKTSGQRAVNLSAARASTLLTLSLLRRALDAGARPKALIVNAKPAVLLGGPEFNARAWQEVVTLRESIELLQITRNAPFVASTLAGRVLPSLRCRLEIQFAVLAGLRDDTDPVRAINPVLWRNWSVNAGANVASVQPSYHGEVAPEVERQLYTDLFYVDPANSEAIERIVKLAAERRIPLFWVLFPLSPKLQSLRDRSGAEDLHERFMQSLVARHSGIVTVLDARRSGYPPSLFVDSTHLNRNGARALSRSVAAVVASRASTPRSASSSPGWILLASPTDRIAGLDDALEDIEDSKRLVKLNPNHHAIAR